MYDKKILFLSLIVYLFIFLILYSYFNKNYFINSKDIINGINNIIIIKKNNSFNENFYFYKNKLLKVKREIIFLDKTVINIDNKIININIEKKEKYFYPIFSRGRFHYGPEDPRIIEYNSNILLFYNYYNYFSVKMMLYNHNLNKNITLNYNGVKQFEKNWSPFIYNNEIYLSYFLNPHTILKLDLNNGDCNLVYNNLKINIEHDIYGGTPSIYIEELDVYFGIGHVKLSIIKYYCIGYLFRAQPPFNIIKISKKFLFFKNSNFKNIEFPIGLQKINNDLSISLGVQDTESYLIKINFNNLIKQIFID
jgi:predicted GH43/DUF377 family glycosyl hydrolase